MVFARDALGYAHALLIHDENMRFLASFDAKLKKADACTAAPALPITSIKFAPDRMLICVTTVAGFDVFALDQNTLLSNIGSGAAHTALPFDMEKCCMLVGSSKFQELYPLSKAFCQARCALLTGFNAHHSNQSFRLQWL